MGVLADSSGGGSHGGQGSWSSLRFLTRRKLVDSAHKKTDGQLAKELSVPHLIGIGVGATIGAGVYILVGTVAREHSGPALAFSFLIAGLAAALSAFCYAELASRCPSAGSAYHYSYICIGEGAAWLIGWALILEYTIGSSAVARGISPNMASFFGGMDHLPVFLARHHIPGTDIVVDPCAAIVTLIITGLLCVGIKESTIVQGIVTSVNVCALFFVIFTGAYLGFKSGWAGYELPSGYFPFGFDGLLAGSATVFFAYIGFDSVASTAEEVKNPQRDLPLGIGAALFLCCALYMIVSIVVVGLVPYYAIDPDTPISSAFANHGMQWAAYVINAGAFTALCSSLMGGILPQPRILMAMARDGLLPPFFSDINKCSQVPLKSTVTTGLAAAIMAALMDVSELAGMVSVGTLLAFTMVAVSILILRYIPPDEVPLPSSLEESNDSSVSPKNSSISDHRNAKHGEVNVSASGDIKPVATKEDMRIHCPLISRHFNLGNHLDEGHRRKILGWTIALTCLGVLILTYAASDSNLPRPVRFTFCGVGGFLVLYGLIFLTLINQDDARHKFGYPGGFLCPWVPLLPIACILINCYLLINLGADTWIRVSIWLAIGVLVYVFYGRTHSSLRNAVYVPVSRVDEMHRSSPKHLA